MVAGCSNNFVKFIIFGINALISLFGLGMLGLGIYSLVDHNARKALHWDDLNVTDYLNSTGKETFEAAAIGVTTLGGLIFIIAFFGCCGAALESRVMLSVYFFFLALIFITELVFGVLSVVVVTNSNFKSQFGNLAKNLTDSELKKVQQDFKCCGDGWNATTPRSSVPCTSDERKNNLGCAQALYDVLHVLGVALGVVALCGVLLQLIAMCFTCCLCMAIGNEHRSY